jgi:electron transfer flavoprotein alpha subunit
VGWESPEDWEYANETLAEKIAKLKKKQDSEVDKPPATATNVDLAKEVAAASQVSKAKRSVEVVSPISSTHSSACGKGAEAEPILQKAIKHATAKRGTIPSPSSQFLAFSSTPELHFMGVVDDCGIALGDGHSSLPIAFLSMI